MRLGTGSDFLLLRARSSNASGFELPSTDSVALPLDLIGSAQV